MVSPLRKAKELPEKNIFYSCFSAKLTSNALKTNENIL
jgi:hypothetical protein